MTPDRVQVDEMIVHEIEVDAESDEAAGDLVHAEQLTQGPRIVLPPWQGLAP